MGKVYLIGCGPGDPGLITIRALEALGEADTIVYDRLINPSLLDWARKDTQLIDVGKARGKHSWAQQEINNLLVEEASKGKIVARLKGGDPFVLGRGGEEALALVDKNIPFEVIPGVSSAIAAPAYAGIPVTHRQVSSSFAVITGHEDPSKKTSSINWANLSTGVDTLIFLMGVENLGLIRSRLIKNGRSKDTPVAIISRGTLPSQQTVTGNLENIVERAHAAKIKAPSIIVVGEVTTLREHLRWYDNRPLFGKRIIITRPKHQATGLSELLQREGALVIEAPTIDIKLEVGEVGNAINKLADFDWLVFTSANGVSAFFSGLEQKSLDARALSNLKICAIGPATAQALASHGIKADLIPDEYSTKGLLASLKRKRIKGKAFLLLRADIAPDELEEKLSKRGAIVKKVSIYKTVFASRIDEDIKEKLVKGNVDIIVFTSSSTVLGFLHLMREKLWNLKMPLVACIGPVTAATAKEAGLKVDVIAKEHTIGGLVNSLKEYIGENKRLQK